VSNINSRAVSALADPRFAVRELQRRVQKLEEEEKKTLLKRVVASASTSALLLGLVLTFASLYDVFIAKPAADRIARINQFNQAVGSAAKIRQELEQFQLQAKEPRLQLIAAAYATPRILNDISTAKAMLSGLSDDEIDMPQLIVLISEALMVGDMESAKVLVGRAVAKPNATSYFKSEARRYEGKFHFAVGDLGQARRSFDLAISALGSNPAAAAAKAYVLSDAATMELAFGNCKVAIEKLERVVAALSAPEIMNDHKMQMKSALATFIAQWPSDRCALPPELSAAVGR